MKVKNKKSGEIEDFIEIINTDDRLFARIGTTMGSVYKKELHSLAELNEEWEDYEEPKGMWAVGEFGELYEVSGLALNRIEELKEIGNCFESEEEAEKAVEKLKAWKRLRDKGFQFHGHSALGCGEITFSLDFEDMDDEGEIGQLRHDLDLLFSPEED